MDFDLTEQQRVARDSLRALLKREVTPEYVRSCDEAERFPSELFATLAQAGWLGLPIPDRLRI